MSPLGLEICRQRSEEKLPASKGVLLAVVCRSPTMSSPMYIEGVLLPFLNWGNQEQLARGTGVEAGCP
jgi:hypothetical protein